MVMDDVMDEQGDEIAYLRQQLAKAARLLANADIPVPFDLEP